MNKAGLRQWLMLGLAMLACASLQAQTSTDVRGSSDYAGINRFPGSHIAEYRVENNAFYSLALGRMQRVNGRVAPREAERYQGDLRRITYEIPSGFGAAEVFGFFRDQLLNSSGEALFSCQARDCGSSNFWANDLFGSRILYGPEGGQYYLAARYRLQIDGETVSGYAALYVITRGNRRMYAHLDFLELPASESTD